MHDMVKDHKAVLKERLDATRTIISERRARKRQRLALGAAPVALAF